MFRPLPFPVSRSVLPVFLAVLVLFGFGMETAEAQIQVGLKFKRRLYVAYEPVLATVSIRNLSGRDLPLADSPGIPWFGFQIMRGDDRPVPPLSPDYQLEPLIIPAGETVERTVNLNTLFPLSEYGPYRVRATIYFSPHQKYYQSAPQNIEISEGKVIWQQTVGVPEGQKGAGETRTYSVMEFRQADHNHIYVRVRDPETAAVYCTFSIGRLLGMVPPQIELDVANTLHILQVTGPKAYLHTQIGPNGEVIGQETLMAVKNRPQLRREASGLVAVRGGVPQSPEVNRELGIGSADNRGIPKLSDRPANLPRE